MWLPLTRVAQQMARVGSAFPNHPLIPQRPVGMRFLCRDVAQVASLAQEYYRKYQEVSYALEESRQLVAEMGAQQHVLIASTNQQIVQQYQSVLSYANYLEEHIQLRSASPDLRFDFDDVCESSFNLKLIAGAFAVLRAPYVAVNAALPLAALMQQTMLALSPSLDRRAMKLTTAEVDETVTAHTDPTIVAHVVWMLLLGIVRYAADESTLRLRCLRSHDGRRAMVSMLVSELSPCAMTASEREAHLRRQLEHLTPHMFAETIRIHANLQLAQLLLAKLDATIEIAPLTSYACEIFLSLPAAP